MNPNENVIVNKNGNNKLFSLLVIVVMVGLIGYSLLTSNIPGEPKNSEEKPTEKKEKEENENKNEIGAIESEAIKEDLAERIRVINLSHGEQSSRKNGSGSFFEYELYNNLDESRLLYGLINYLLITKDESLVKVTDNSLLLEYPNLMYTIDEKAIKEKSLHYFNKDLSNIKYAPNDEDKYGTAWLGLEKVGDKIYVNSTGGDPSPSDIAYTYIYKYEKNDKEAYVYLSATKGIISEDGDNYIIQKGINNKEEYQKFNSEEIEKYLNFKITEENYQTFTKYKYTFEMHDGNYFLKNVSKIE